MAWQYSFPAMIFRWCEGLRIGSCGSTTVRYGGKRRRWSLIHEYFSRDSEPFLSAFPCTFGDGDPRTRLPTHWFLSHSPSNGIPRSDLAADRCRWSLLYFLVAADRLFASVATSRAGNRNDRFTPVYLFRDGPTGLSRATQKRDSRRPSRDRLRVGRSVDDPLYRFQSGRSNRGVESPERGSHRPLQRRSAPFGWRIRPRPGGIGALS